MKPLPNLRVLIPTVGVTVLAWGAISPTEAAGRQDPPADPAIADLNSVPNGSRVRTTAPKLPLSLPEVVVQLEPGVSVERVAKAAGLKVLRKSRLEGAWLLAARDVAAAERAASSLSRTQGVRGAFVNQKLPHAHRSFVPNDPYFSIDFPEPASGGQFNLHNPQRPGHDTNLMPIWAEGVTGEGVTIGIVDNGIEIAHPDLAPNVSAADSIDIASGSLDPSPRYEGDDHGTFVAGCAVARGGNGIGITGAAPYARLAGIRTDDRRYTAEHVAAAIGYRSEGARPAIPVKNHSYGTSIPFEDQTLVCDTYTRTGAVGTIHVIAGGNARGEAVQDGGKDAVNNVPTNIVVGALRVDGRFARYSTFGANLTTTAYGGEYSAWFGHVSTDRTTVARGYSATPRNLLDAEGNYAKALNGTSFTAPVVAGVMALGKQAQPRLNARWAKHLLARTCVQNDPNDDSPVGGWTTNGAGFHYNPNYGFGQIDATAFVRLARATGAPTPVRIAKLPKVEVRTDVADLRTVTRAFNVSETRPLEEVLVNFDITHRRRGHLEAYLVSPAGTRSRLFIRSAGDTGRDIRWTFMSNAFWGENPRGRWTLEVRDTLPSLGGRWNSYQATLRMGSLTPAVNP